MCAKTVGSIKRSQRESLLHREIAQLLHSLIQDDSELHGLAVNRVQLSPDKSICFVLFYSIHGKSFFEERFQKLLLYKPSLRSALAQSLSSRYVPNLIFKYDEQFAKQEQIEQLLDSLKTSESE